jgi:5-deoxy-glucuronate isomerase
VTVEAARRQSFHRKAGTSCRDGWGLRITPEDAGWGHAGLSMLELGAGESRTFETGDDEVVVLPLSGACQVTCDAEGVETADLAGRDDVFQGPTDFVYAPRDSLVTISSAGGGRFAIPSARATRRLPFRYRPAADIAIELRGSGPCSREVRNFAAASEFEADRLIAVEVLTPGGNWGSYPPHKHDEQAAAETALEEIYYYEIAAGPMGPGFAYQRVYASDAGPIDVLVEVRAGDVVLIPHGWHGPTMAPPGYDLYYLNVMAGPGPERAWRTTDDPTHAWVRETWLDLPIDPRLPFGRRGESG